MKKKWHGMNWIRKEKRLRIYARDLNACVWCGATFHALALDHVVPRSKGGTNHASNLITSCKRCNDSRRDLDVEAFAESFPRPDEALARVAAATERPLP